MLIQYNNTTSIPWA